MSIQQELELFDMFLLGLPPNPQIRFLSGHPHFTNRIAAELHLSLQLLELRPLILPLVLCNRRQNATDFFLVVPFLGEIEDVFNLP